MARSPADVFRAPVRRPTFQRQIRNDPGRLPSQSEGELGRVDHGIRLKLNRTFRYKGQTHHYLTASCPAPKGFSGATFAFAKAEFVFAGTTVESTLNRSCRAKG